MKLSKDIQIDNFEDKTILSKVLENGNIDTSNVFVLEGVSKLIFDDVLKNMTNEQIAEDILNIYDVSRQQVSKDIVEFLTDLTNRGILTNE